MTSGASIVRCIYAVGRMRVGMASTVAVEPEKRVATTGGVCGSLLRPHHRRPVRCVHSTGVQTPAEGVFGASPTRRGPDDSSLPARGGGLFGCAGTPPARLSPRC